VQQLLFQCKHDFCWVCLESWKKHSTATGGYFRCNRYEVVRKVEEQQESLKTEVKCQQTIMQFKILQCENFHLFVTQSNFYKYDIHSSRAILHLLLYVLFCLMLSTCWMYLKLIDGLNDNKKV
jgi:hypothetical protein